MSNEIPFYETDAYKIRAYDEVLATLAEITQHIADCHTDERTPTATALGWQSQRWVAADGEVCLALGLVYRLAEDPTHPDAGQGLIESGVIGCGVDTDNPLMTGEWFDEEAAHD